MSVHASAIVADDTELGAASSVGPFAICGVDGPGGRLVVGDECTIRSHAVIYRSTRIGHRVHAGHGALIREETTIGDDVSIGSHSVIEHHVVVEDRVRIHGNVFVPEHSILESDAWIGPSVTVTNARYPNRPDTKSNLEGVHVCTGAVIGAAAVLLPGVVIGRGSIVGAGAVVVRDVEPGQTIVGNPGRAL